MVDEQIQALGIGDELFWEPTRLVTPNPWVGHLPFAFWLTKAVKPETFVELGTHSGNSYFAFCQALAAMPTPGRAFAVDTWKGDDHSGTYGEGVFADVTAFNDAHYPSFSTLMRATFDDARAYFPDACIDLLHIDGMHSYEAVKHDFETWRTALTGRAVVVFHDTNVRERGFGVWKLWQELSEQHPAFEFNHSNGLGVLGVGGDQTGPMRALFACAGDPEAAAQVRRRFAARGEAFQRRVQTLAQQAETAVTIAALQADAARLRDELARAHSTAEGVRDELSHETERVRADLQARLKHTERELEAQVERTAAELKAHAERHDQTQRWAQEVIRVKDGVVQAKDTLIGQLHAAVQARDAIIRVRDRHINERDAGIQERDRHLQAAEARQRRLEFEHKERVRVLEEQIQAAAIVRKELHYHLARTAWDHRNEARRLQEQLVVKFESTTSWKMTGPLRRSVDLLRRRPSHPMLLPFEPEPAPELPEDVPPIRQALEVGEMPVPAEPGAAAEDAQASQVVKAALRAQFASKLGLFLSTGAKLRLPAAAGEPDVSIVLVLYNQAELTYGCLLSIAECLGGSTLGVEVVILDNASTDRTADLLERVEGAHVIASGHNQHFLLGANRAAEAAIGRHVLFLNNDAQLLPGAVEAAVAVLDGDPAVGAVGGRIILPDGTLQEAGSIVWNDGTCLGYGRGGDPNAAEFMFQRDVDFCSGAFLMTPRPVFERMSGFDPRYAPAYYEEVDYCLRLWEAGQRVVFEPDCAILHYEFGSAQATDQALVLQRRNRVIFAKRHAAWLRDQCAPAPGNALSARTARFTGKRVLMIEDRVPREELGAGHPRSNRMLHELAAAGVAVTFFPAGKFEETWPGVRRAVSRRIEVLKDHAAPQLRAHLEERQGFYDAVLVCRPHNMTALLAALGPDRGLLGSAQVIYDAEAVFARRTLIRDALEGKTVNATEAQDLTAEEIALTRIADAVISVSPAERELFEAHGVKPVHLLVHAIDDKPIPAGFGQRPDIVFLGAMTDDNSPNADSVLWFATEVLPRLREHLGWDITLKVIGLNRADAVSALDGTALELVGQVDDLHAALRSARIMVVPTRFAAGVPLKTLQAAMMGIPMVVSDLILGQLGWQDGQDLLAASDPDGFAAACARLYQDEALWENIRASALSKARVACAPEPFRATIREIVAQIPFTHQMPPPARVKPGALKTVSPPFAGRQIEQDFSVAVPFSYPAEPLKAAPSLAVICHLFHPEMAEEFRAYLNNIPFPADLCISTDTEQKRARIAGHFSGWDRGKVELRVTPNRGRDIAPKLVGFRDAHESHDYVLHLHSKASHHAEFLAPWRHFLLENLVGSPEIVRSVFEAFHRLPKLGVVLPQHFEPVRRWLDWNGNFPAAQLLAARMGVALQPDRALDFPSGSMFWARTAALRPLLDLNLRFEDFPEENGKLDTTPAHAIERLYLFVCEKAGYRWLKTAQPALYVNDATICDIGSPAALDEFMAVHGALLTGLNPLPRQAEPPAKITQPPPGLLQKVKARVAEHASQES